MGKIHLGEQWGGMYIIHKRWIIQKNSARAENQWDCAHEIPITTGRRASEKSHEMENPTTSEQAISTQRIISDKLSCCVLSLAANALHNYGMNDQSRNYRLLKHTQYPRVVRYRFPIIY